jgi:hypothetical protein
MAQRIQAMVATITAMNGILSPVFGSMISPSANAIVTKKIRRLTNYAKTIARIAHQRRDPGAVRLAVVGWSTWFFAFEGVSLSCAGW